MDGSGDLANDFMISRRLAEDEDDDECELKQAVDCAYFDEYDQVKKRSFENVEPVPNKDDVDGYDCAKDIHQ